MMRHYYSHVRRDSDGQVTERTLLSFHLSTVANATSSALAHGGDSLQRLGALAGLSHDFGKFTTYFQTYLVTGEPHKSGLQQHSFISALYGAFESYRLADEFAWLDRWDPLLIYLAIKHHHGDLANLTQDIGQQWMEDGDVLGVNNNLADPLSKTQQQIQDVSMHMEGIITELTQVAHAVESLLPDRWSPQVEPFVRGGWWETFNRLVKDAYSYRREVKSNGHPFYVRLLQCFSALIDADKRDAAHLMTAGRPTVPVDIVDDYVAEKNRGESNGMSKIRQGLYTRTRQRAERWGEKGLFTLTAPTGSGKTLSALSAAMRLRHHAQSNGGPVPRIIYAMPFTSIIDQNHGELRKVLSAVDSFKDNEHRYLMMHHHLAPVKAQKGGKELPVEDVLMLQEGWDSEFVVTTFVQLFDTLLGYRNRALKKFHRLTNSILILDEVQSLPAELWPLVGNALQLAADQCNVKIMLMTATQPQLLNAGADFVELAGEPGEVRDMFEQLDRMDLHVDLSPISVERFVNEFFEAYRPDGSYLLIFNTIRTSLHVFQALGERLEDNVDKLTYLSSNVVPTIRRQRVKRLAAESKAGHPMVIVATQVVEAGVDLDVDVVYRELAPIDAIVQAAGRCNRNSGSSEKGEVRVFPLVPELGQRNSMERVYKTFKSDATLRTLRKKLGDGGSGVIREAELPELVSNYFKSLADQTSKGDSEQIWDAMSDLNFSPGQEKGNMAVCDFRLIDEYPYYVDLFVECTDDARELWEWYQISVVSERDFRRRQDNYLRRKAELKGYIISVHMKRAMALSALQQGDGSLWYLPGVANGHEYYHPITGLALRPVDISLLW